MIDEASLPEVATATFPILHQILRLELHPLQYLESHQLSYNLSHQLHHLESYQLLRLLSHQLLRLGSQKLLLYTYDIYVCGIMCFCVYSWGATELTHEYT